MKRNGFTLIELMVVVAIMGILLKIVTMVFSSRMSKDKVEGQVRVMYADLMNARSQALFQKKTRSVVISTSLFSGYSSQCVTATPVQTTYLKVPVTPATLQIDFDSHGGLTFNGDSTITSAAVCVQGSNTGYNDSIAATPTQIQVGKLTGTTGCTSANITRN